ncbi:UNVERIFIED_CONTAM: CBL-interacting serine/threonine-protein kinase [Sesamum radiatum]|uniref:non-specific serine/threonine protein kinase n=1 Tax=Sesamum radiatum TaxID=300843 RepID=A0AAW2WIP2_SESRA
MYTKIFKAEYEFPPWFSYEAKRLISRLLVADPERRITIQGIMRVPWFCRGFTRPAAFTIQEPIDQEKLLEQSKELELVRSKSSPPFYNAFEFISSMSSGFDLSNLFENRTKSGSLFTSRCSASSIMAKLESLAKKLNFRVVSSKDYKLRMQGVSEGRKGKLSVTAEVYEVSPEVAVVEFSKSAGDTLEYRKLCEDDIRPALKDIVWSWQGESCACQD